MIIKIQIPEVLEDGLLKGYQSTITTVNDKEEEITVPSMSLGDTIIIGCGVSGVIIQGDSQSFILADGTLTSQLTSTSLGNSITLVKGVFNTFGIISIVGTFTHL